MPSSMAVPAGEGEMEPITGENTKRVCYFFDSDIGNYHYGPGHPMKPTRIRMTHSLVMNYGLYKKMEIFRAKPATKREMSQFHTDEYVDFLYRITPENAQTYIKEQSKYNVGDDCPVFDGLFEYCSISAGGSMEGAARLSRDKCDIAVNWAGGLHHAKKAEASGFCYVNDIVLGILELLRYHPRVLYIDIDVHHGDGVEEAFYTTDRVMTVSFHKYGEFFPGTGASRDIGIGKGKGYAVNVPLRDGVTDDCYQDIFQSVVGRCVEWYQPGAIVLQCGADSLAGDKIGCFNMSMQGHASCVEYVKKFNLPLLLLGGGGYTIKAVSRAWAYETGLAAGQKLGKEIPSNEYYEYFGPDYQLDVRANNMEDMNTPEFMHKIKSLIFDQLRDKTAAPGVQGHAIPKLAHDDDDDDTDSANSDERLSRKYLDNHIQHQTELSDSEDEGMGGRKHRQSHGPAGEGGKRRRTPVNGAASIGGRKSTPPSVLPQGGLGGQSTGTRSRTRSPAFGGTASTSASATPAPQLISVNPAPAETVQPPPSGTVVSTGAIVPTSVLDSNGSGVENAIAGPSTLPSVSTTTTNGSPSTVPPATAPITAATSTNTSPPLETPNPSIHAPSFGSTTFPPPPPPNTTTDTPVTLPSNLPSNPIVGSSDSNANLAASISTNAQATSPATPANGDSAPAPAPGFNELDADAMDVDVDAVVADLEEGIRTGRIDQEIGGNGNGNGDRNGNGSENGVDVEMNDGTEVVPPTTSAPEHPPLQSFSTQETMLQLETTGTIPSTDSEPIKPVFSSHSIMPTNVSMDDDLPPSNTSGSGEQSGQPEGR